MTAQVTKLSCVLRGLSRLGLVMLFCGWASAVTVYATKIIDPRTLSQIVAQSDFVVIGQVTGAFALDAKGNEIVKGNPESGPGWDTQLGFEVSVSPSQVLKSSGSGLPAALKVFCMKGPILDLNDLKALRGRQFIFLLRRAGDHLEGTHAGFCAAGIHFMSELDSIWASLGSLPAGDLVPPERTALFPAEKGPELLRAVCYEAPASDGYWSPTPADLVGVETTLISSLHKAGGDFGRSFFATRREWWKEFRQVAGITRNGHRYLFVSYFAGMFYPDNWKTQVVQIFDGGPQTFRALYDCDKKEFVWFEFNGEA